MLKLIFILCVTLKRLVYKRSIIGVRYSEEKQCMLAENIMVTSCKLIGGYLITNIKAYDTDLYVMLKNDEAYSDMFHNLQQDSKRELIEIMTSKFNTMTKRKRFFNGTYGEYLYYKTNIEKIPRAATSGEVLLWNNSVDGIAIYGIANKTVDMDEKLVLHEICKLMDDFHVA